MILEVALPIFICWNLLGLIAFTAYTDLSDVFSPSWDKFYDPLNPVWLYENYKVNYFGLVVLTLVFNFACPLATILCWIGKGLSFLMTIGRK